MSWKRHCAEVFTVVGILLAAVNADAAETSWMSRFSPQLRNVEQRLAAIERARADLGEPMIGNTVTRLGYHHPQVPTPPPVAPWVQIDLGRPQPIDTVVLIPTITDYQPLGANVFAFPLRFRVDVSDDPDFERSVPLIVHADDDYEFATVAPVVVAARGIVARFVRLTALRLPKINGTYFYTLAEVMVLSGHRNVAIRAPVSASASAGSYNRWGDSYLTDGCTPLGPPIHRGDLPPFDALFAVDPPGGGNAWMAVDLRQERVLDEIRLHPLHAWQGADVPGYAFPARFRIESSTDERFATSDVIFENPDSDWPNPGNNPVILPADGIKARFVRLVVLRHHLNSSPPDQRLGLSEFEVYADGGLASANARALSSGARLTAPPRPVSLLTDGRTSFGRIIELPHWIEEWRIRHTLEKERRGLELDLPRLRERTAHRLMVSGGGLVFVAASAVGFGLYRSRRLRIKEREALRNRLAQDLHDEIGSNLAGIAVLAETASLRGTEMPELGEINRVARETTDAMHEVLWLVGARQVGGIDLGRHLRLVAMRLLPRTDLHWDLPPEPVLHTWPADARRDFFLFFKEALANVSRHAKATEVRISLSTTGPEVVLSVSDNGRGFTPGTIERGLGLQSLHARAENLKGHVEIHSSPGKGTNVRLRVPLTQS